MIAIFYLFLALQLEVSQWRKHKADFLLVLLYLLSRMFNQCSQSNPSSGLDYMGVWTLHGCKRKTNVGDTEKFLYHKPLPPSLTAASKAIASVTVKRLPYYKVLQVIGLPQLPASEVITISH